MCVGGRGVTVHTVAGLQRRRTGGCRADLDTAMPKPYTLNPEPCHSDGLEAAVLTLLWAVVARVLSVAGADGTPLSIDLKRPDEIRARVFKKPQQRGIIQAKKAETRRRASGKGRRNLS